MPTPTTLKARAGPALVAAGLSVAPATAAGTGTRGRRAERPHCPHLLI